MTNANLQKVFTANKLAKVSGERGMKVTTGMRDVVASVVRPSICAGEGGARVLCRFLGDEAGAAAHVPCKASSLQ